MVTVNFSGHTMLFFLHILVAVVPAIADVVFRDCNCSPFLFFSQLWVYASEQNMRFERLP